MFAAYVGHRRGHKLDRKAARIVKRTALGTARWEAQRSALGMPHRGKSSGSAVVDLIRVTVLATVLCVQGLVILLALLARLAVWIGQRFGPTGRRFATGPTRTRRFPRMPWTPVTVNGGAACPLCQSSCKVVTVREDSRQRVSIWCPRCAYSWTTVAASLEAAIADLADVASIEQAGPPDAISEPVVENDPEPIVTPTTVTPVPARRSRTRRQTRRPTPSTDVMADLLATTARIEALLAGRQ